MAKQSELKIVGKGVERVALPQLDRLAEDYCKERDKRLKLTPKEVAAKGKLIDAMHAHADQIRRPDGTLVYRYDEKMITVTPGKEKLKVAEVGTDDEED
jgi:hypothetical protein